MLLISAPGFAVFSGAAAILLLLIHVNKNQKRKRASRRKSRQENQVSPVLYSSSQSDITSQNSSNSIFSIENILTLLRRSPINFMNLRSLEENLKDFEDLTKFSDLGRNTIKIEHRDLTTHHCQDHDPNLDLSLESRLANPESSTNRSTHDLISELIETLLYLPVEPQIPNQSLDLLDKLRLLIQRIIEETANLPNLANSDGHGRRSRTLNETNFSEFGGGLNEKDNYLANNNFEEVIRSYQSRHFQYQEQDLISSGIHSAGSDFENSSNNSKIDESNLKSGDFGENTNHLDKYTSELNSIQSSLESMSCLSRLSDVEDNQQESCATHRRRQIPEILDSETNELWKSNWLLSPSPNHRLTPSPVPMLIPSPTGECRTMIGDVDVEDILDLSENNSVEDESEESEGSVESDGGYDTVDVPTILVKSRTVIGGKDPLIQELTNHGDSKILSPKTPIKNTDKRSTICHADINQLIYELSHNLDYNNEKNSIEADDLHQQKILQNGHYDDNERLESYEDHMEKYEKINNNNDYIHQKKPIQDGQDSNSHQDKSKLSKHGLVNVYVNGEKINLDECSGTQFPIYDPGYQSNEEWKRVYDSKPDPPKAEKFIEIGASPEPNFDSNTQESCNANVCEPNFNQVTETKKVIDESSPISTKRVVDTFVQEISDATLESSTEDSFDSESSDAKSVKTENNDNIKCEYTPETTELITDQIRESQSKEIKDSTLDNKSIKLSGNQDVSDNLYDNVQNPQNTVPNMKPDAKAVISNNSSETNKVTPVLSRNSPKVEMYRPIKIVPYVPILDEEVDLSFLLKTSVILSDDNISESDDSKPIQNEHEQDSQKTNNLPEFSTLTKSRSNKIAQALNADILVNKEQPAANEQICEESSDTPNSISAEVVAIKEEINASEEDKQTCTENEEGLDEVEDVEQIKFVPGSIAEREHMKWQNAAPISKNPYSIEELNKRLENTQYSVIDFQVRSHSLDGAINKSFNENSNENKPTDFKRYGRDYYVNEAKRACGTKKQQSVDENLLTRELAMTTFPTQSENVMEKTSTELYNAKPIIIIEDTDRTNNQRNEFESKDDKLIEIIQSNGENIELYKNDTTLKNLNLEDKSHDLKLNFDDLKAKFDKEDSKLSSQNTKIINKNLKSNEKAAFDTKIKPNFAGDLYEAQFMPKFQLKNELNDGSNKTQHRSAKVSNSINDLEKQKSNLNKVLQEEKKISDLGQNSHVLDTNTDKLTKGDAEQDKLNFLKQGKHDVYLEQTFEKKSGLENGPSVKELTKKFLSSKSFIGQPSKKFMHQKLRRSSENLSHTSPITGLWPPTPGHADFDAPRYNNQVHSLTARNLSKEFRDNLKTPKKSMND